MPRPSFGKTIALASLLMTASCGGFIDDCFDTDPPAHKDAKNIRLLGFVDPTTKRFGYWEASAPANTLPKEFFSVQACKLADPRQGSQPILLFVDVDGKRYTILKAGQLYTSAFTGMAELYAYTDQKSFETVRAFLLQHTPESAKPDLKNWSMQPVACEPPQPT